MGTRILGKGRKERGTPLVGKAGVKSATKRIKTVRKQNPRGSAKAIVARKHKRDTIWSE